MLFSVPLRLYGFIFLTAYVFSRIPVWVLIQAKRLGTSEADLPRSYPTLRAEHLTNAWAYFRSHRDEIEQ